MYGGINIVAIGDKHQFYPVGGDPVFKVRWSEHWHGSVNCCIFLKNDHRFKDDPLFGQILKRMRMGNTTLDDIKIINKRWLGNSNVHLPHDGNICYAVPFNRDRNAISTQVFADLVEKTHPSSFSDTSSVPNHCIIIESSIRKGNTLTSENFHNWVFNHCGDADVTTAKNKKIDPALKFYNGIFLMINTNKDLKNGRGNGTLCRGVGL